MDQDSPHRVLFGLPVRAETMDEAVAGIERVILDRGPRPVLHLALNAAKLSQIERDPGFRELVTGFDRIHADGAPIVWASRLLGRPLPERIAGIDLMLQLVERAAQRGLRPYFLGARPEAVEACVARLRKRWPALQVAGLHHGYWSEADAAAEDAVVATVRGSRADLLFVALPTPRKERFLLRHRESLGVPFAMGVGGSFDVIAGIVKRAPVAWQAAGMEWAYRLLQEPSKMWKRYLTTNLHFAWLVAREVVRGSGPQPR
jgi:N-acetylglucosaminyldiphosphoundecaprenol N-acetyl-beta-D-mannosaminyltransferase